MKYFYLPDTAQLHRVELQQNHPLLNPYFPFAPGQTQYV
jgi:hypothetical protein